MRNFRETVLKYLYDKTYSDFFELRLLNAFLNIDKTNAKNSERYNFDADTNFDILYLVTEMKKEYAFSAIIRRSLLTQRCILFL